jgi:acyl-CoA reductase-like NAD-dependent aldehyde dehydrogenase
LYRIESITWFAEEAKRVCGDIVETPAKDKQFLVMKQPIGVVGAITPWNFPFSMITRKVSPALAAGCTVCLKPSELTPLTAMALAELGKRAGIPSGVLNIVSGNAVDIGKSLTESKKVRKIAFTGSTRVGKLLYAASAGTVKRVSLELGGNAPYIVFEDADVNLAARDVVLSSYRNAGQTCICTNRVFVHESIYDSFNSALAQNVANLRVGDGLVPGVTHGPLISKIAVEQVDAKVQDAIQKGGKVLLGGSRPQFNAKELNTGFFYQPTVIIGSSNLRQTALHTFHTSIPRLTRFFTNFFLRCKARHEGFQRRNIWPNHSCIQVLDRC